MFLWECHVSFEREVAFCAVNLGIPFFSIIVEYIPMIFIMFFFLPGGKEAFDAAYSEP